jgi:hypothetical protein
VAKCYGLHANCFVVKPVQFDAFTAAARSIEQFWFDVATLAPLR